MPSSTSAEVTGLLLSTVTVFFNLAFPKPLIAFNNALLSLPPAPFDGPEEGPGPFIIGGGGGGPPPFIIGGAFGAAGANTTIRNKFFCCEHKLFLNELTE